VSGSGTDPVDEPVNGCEQRFDAAAYVLGALEGAEVEAYRGHLAGCVACSEELRQLQPVADSLALAVPRVDAPEELRAKLMAVVHAESELLHAAGHEADRPARARAARRWRLAPAVFAAAVAVAAGVLFGALVLDGGSTRHTRVIQASVLAPAGKHATAALRVVDSQAQLVVKGMPAPPQGRIYEVWFERGSQPPEPTDARFSVTSHGDSSVQVPGNLNGVSKVLVTDEPLGGSLKPTRAPIIVATV
jgi:Anti-sigma-K factor rskA/Putative zinc-finger